MRMARGMMAAGLGSTYPARLPLCKEPSTPRCPPLALAMAWPHRNHAYSAACVAAACPSQPRPPAMPPAHLCTLRPRRLYGRQELAAWGCPHDGALSQNGRQDARHKWEAKCEAGKQKPRRGATAKEHTSPPAPALLINFATSQLPIIAAPATHDMSAWNSSRPLAFTVIV